MQFYCGMQRSLHAVSVPEDRVRGSHEPRWEGRGPRSSDWSELPLQGAPAETPSLRVGVAVALVAGGLSALVGLKKLLRR